MPEADDVEIVHVVFLVPTPEYPQGFEADLCIPRNSIKQAALPPFWRHGETLTIYPAPHD